MNTTTRTVYAAILLAVAPWQGRAQESPPSPTIARYVIKALPAPRSFDYFEPRRINNAGEILGKADASRGVFADESHVAFYRRGKTVDLHVLAPGHRINRISLPLDLNDQGQLLFYSFGGSPKERYFLYQEGRVWDFSQIVGRSDLEPLGLNASGQIVGTTTMTNNRTEAFLYADGQVTLLPSLALFPQSYAIRISNSGYIVGTAEDESLGDARTVLFTSAGPLDLRVPRSYGLDVNDAAHVLASSFLWLGPDRIVPLDFVPTGLNQHDQVVGYVYPPWPPRAVLHADGVTYELKDLIESGSDWELLYAFDLNDQGQIAGLGKKRGRWTGFLLSPSE